MKIYLKKYYILTVVLFCVTELNAQNKTPFFSIGTGTLFHIASPTDIDPVSQLNSGYYLSIGGGFSFNRLLALGIDINGALINPTNWHYEEIGEVTYFPVYINPKIMINGLSSNGLNVSAGPVLSRFIGVTNKGWNASLGYNLGNMKINVGYTKEEKDKFILNVGLNYFLHK